MSSPPVVFTIVLASLYGLVFYVIFGHGWLRLLLYWLVGIAGFFLGQWIAHLLGLAVFNVGEVNLVEGTLLSWASLFAARAWERA